MQKLFTLTSDFKLSQDQKNAVDGIVKAFNDGAQYATLLGVTGSGKTFSMANIIARLNIPTLIMTHNKSLAAQLYSEFKGFFSKDYVEYFISYYDYYQPEAYIPRQDLFIEKDSSINDELERMRLSASANLLSFDNVIVIASVSANYGLGNPGEYQGMVMFLELNQKISQKELLLKLVDMGYKRNDAYFDRGDFRVNGDVVDIYPAYYNDSAIRIEFFGDEIEALYSFDALENKKIQNFNKFTLYATSQFIVSQNRLQSAILGIQNELSERLKFYKENNRLVEYQRLKQRVEFDLEMLKTTGMTKGIENYARYLTGQMAGQTPYTMFDYYEIKNKEYLVIVDESHVSLPQFRGMYAGDKSRKDVLVEYGFRLPSALDNRPLKFDEFINKKAHFLFVSATPNAYELELSKGCVYEQILRPTGLLDPKIEVIPSDNQVEILYDRAKKSIQNGDKVLVTTLTKKMAQELCKYYLELGIKVKYIHSDIDAIERNELIRGLRTGVFDMLIGINLLREGLDLPEVALVAVMDADKEGFLRSATALIQTMGRAARNENGTVLLFANKITKSMQEAIDITTHRRKSQDEYNKAHGITPRSVARKVEQSLHQENNQAELLNKSKKLDKLPANERAKIIKELKAQMLQAAKNLEFEKAIALRDEIAKLREI
ncbi:MAG: UvrABC nucleotide excision repair complex, subunit UvrB [Candidatus Campylobacter infans]|nr:MAG: UvrABC nucleotide excision repair complex, subunit UvrB [Candidatus Campylobacter infans]